jgi:SpoVK/Ycf46/Vps4 family AAA+-type ATPase
MPDPLDSPSIPAALREALRQSPDNVPLLLHVADSLLGRASYADAEALFRRAVSLDPKNLPARTGLATAFHQQGKHSEAMVLVESLVAEPAPPPAALLLHARLAMRAGEPRLAARQYLAARNADPTLADAALEQELGNYLPQPGVESPVRAPRPPPPPDPADEPTGDIDETRQPQRDLAGDQPGQEYAEIEKPALTFADVGGMDGVKEEVRMKILLPLQQPELFRAYGKSIGGGILLYGPPGCGKTFLARATAGEVRASFISVGLNDVLDMWIGQSERNLHAIFEQARSHKPCVLFFDEVDALGANRGDMVRNAGRHLINQFLSELDGVQANNEGVLILAATNAPWHLDPAFRRPGRFDRILFVPPPDLPARASILRLHLRGKPVGPIDFEVLAKRTDGFSGADLRAVVDLTVEAKLREAMKSGLIKPLETRDLTDAAKRHRPTVRDWFETARNYALYANQSGLYDDVLEWLKLKR